MADTYTTLLDLTKFEVGSRNNTWGSAFGNELDAIDEAVAGVGAISTTGGTTTLTKAQARERIQRITGTLASNAIIEVPATSSWYIFINDTTGAFTVTVRPAGGAGATITQSTKNLVRSNGSTCDVFEFGSASGSFQPLDAELTAIAGLTSAADRLPYFTGSGSASLATFTAFGRSLVDDADATAARSTLGLGTAATTAASAYQAADAELTALAGLTSAADALPYFTGSGTAAVTTLSSFMRTVLDDADAATARATLGITGANIAFTPYGNLAATDIAAAIRELEDEKGTVSGDVSGKVNRTGDTFSGTVGFGDASYIVYLSGSDAIMQWASGDYMLYDRTGNDLTVFIGSVARFFLSGSTAEIGGNTIWHAGNDGSGSGLDADTLRATTPSSFGLSLLDDANAAAARSTLGLGTAATSATGDFQAADATLTALAGVTTAADRLIYATGSDAFTVTTFTSFARSLLDDADAATMRSTLGLVIGTNVQAQDSELSALAGLTSAADTFPYFTGSGTAALGNVTSFARSILDDGDATTVRATLGLGTAATTASSAYQAADAELAAIAGLTSAADRLPYFTGSGTAALATFTSAGRALVDDADASAQLTTLGVSTFIKTLLDDADAATARATLGAGTGNGSITGGANGITTSGANLILDTNNNGGIGQLLLMQNVLGSTIAGGDTVNGANIKYLDIATTGFTPTVTANAGTTWRNVNGASVANNAIGLFIRTA
jgi:hypothetical protein